ncbi:MAG TPA: hypothetical protein VJU18_07215 [Vicinamibacteria bacterium]|nr:hypothetical protein [Vicinamibacteria bacterium]
MPSSQPTRAEVARFRRPWPAPALLVLTLLAPPTSRAEVVERIVAVVDGRPVLLSEVRLLARVRGETEKAALSALIDERLMFREASRLSQAAVAQEEEARVLAALKDKLRAGLEEPEAELRRLVRRQLGIVKYIEFRFRPQVRVGDEAVRGEYESRYANAGGAPSLSAVAEEIRDALAERELNAKIEAWVKDLRSQAEIRENP